jgi:hypothetical protein
MTLYPLEPEADAQAILSRASDVGFSLVQRETDTGQLVWEWRHGDRPRPQFLHRNVAIDWMHDYLAFRPRESNDL